MQQSEPRGRKQLQSLKGLTAALLHAMKLSQLEG
jgi:hypothetical protein